MKKYILFISTFLLLVFSVKVIAEDVYSSATVYNTNSVEPICVWVGHEPSYPVEVTTDFTGYLDIIFNGTWEAGYTTVKDNYFISGFLGTCSSNINTDGSFINESKVVEASGSVDGYFDYMEVNFNGNAFDVQVHYLDFDPTVITPTDADVYSEFLNTSTDETMCFYINGDTANAVEVLPGQYGWANTLVSAEMNGTGYITNYNDTINVSAFAGVCSSNIDGNGIIDQAKVVTKDISFDGEVNIISVEFNGSRLSTDVVYMDEYQEYHDEHLEPASVPAAIAISTVTTVASVGVASAIASGTASTVASTTATTVTTAASNAMSAPKLQNRFKDRYVKGYKLNAKTSFEKGAQVGVDFTLDVSILRKYSGGKTKIDEELTKELSIRPLSEMIQKVSETKDQRGVHGVYKVIGASMEPLLIEFRLTVGKKEIVQTIEIPVL